MRTDLKWMLVLNSGSSSVKFALVDPATGDRAVDGLCERVGGHDATVVVRRGNDRTTIVADDALHRGVRRSRWPPPTAHLLPGLDIGPGGHGQPGCRVPQVVSIQAGQPDRCGYSVVYIAA